MAHALLSASSAHRWLHCTRSARFEQQFPGNTSEYAEEGSLAHKLAELKLRQYFETEKASRRAFTTRHNKLKKNERYQPEMEGYTDTYTEYVKSTALAYEAVPFISIETKVDYSIYAPEGFGTADCIIIGGSTMHVIDFKYGKGVPVYAQNNPQMMLYALGALNLYGFLYDIETVTLSVVQPRLDNTNSWSLPAMELYDWAADMVQPKAKLAYAGEGDFCAGEWCRFCRGKAQCRARADINTALEDFKDCVPTADELHDLPPSRPLLSDEEIGDLLIRGKGLVAWYKDLEEYATKALLDGKTVKGWKLVAGRSNRTFSDQDAALQAIIAAGYDTALVYDRKPKSLPELEKLLGKQEFMETVGDFVVKPTGRPTLAPETDSREAYSPAAIDFEGVV